MAARLSYVVALTALTTLCASTTVRAATLYGALRANFGDGYVLIDDGTQARPGVSVMAKPGSSGEIVYDDGCREPVEAPNVVIVQDPSPCVEAAGPWPIYTLGGAGVIAGSILVSDDEDIDWPASP